MKKLIFITSNKHKLEEAQAIFPGIEARDIDLPEIQEIDPKKVIEAKLLEAFKCHKGEYIVEDTSLYLDAIPSLPGPLIKWFLKALGREGLYGLTEKYDNFGAQAKCYIGHISEQGEVSYFEGAVSGRVVSPRGESSFGWDPIFQPDGYELTFAEMGTEEKNKISHRKKALIKLKEALEK